MWYCFLWVPSELLEFSFFKILQAVSGIIISNMWPSSVKNNGGAYCNALLKFAAKWYSAGELKIKIKI